MTKPVSIIYGIPLHKTVEYTVIQEVAKLNLRTEMDYLDLSALEETGYSRTRPFLAEMTVN